jgi:hypothetical protein
MFEDEELETESQAYVNHKRDQRPFVASSLKAARAHKPYTPQFSETAVVSVRRLAWALQISMPKAVDLMVGLMPTLLDPSKVCPVCKDSSKCSLCTFSQPAAEKAAPVA